MLLDLPQPFAILFEKGELNVELFAPRGNTPRQHAGVSCTDTDSMRWGTGGSSRWLRVVNPEVFAGCS